MAAPRIHPLVSVEEVRERLAYNPETGELRWRKGRKQIAGYIKTATLSRGGGYREIEWRTSAPGKRKGRKTIYLRAHRVAWALATGVWPSDEIDHRDGNRDNNRLANLREATSAENKQNRAPKRGKPWSMLGVSKVPRCKNRWRADMSCRYLGTFGSSEEAHQAYLAAKAKYHAFQPQVRGG